jgi:thiol:disulfide interchange protein DsbC
MLKSRILFVAFFAAVGSMTTGSLAVGAEEADISSDDPRVQIMEMLPNLKLEDIREAPVAGLYEVTFLGQVIYVSRDTRFLVKGDIIDLETHDNLTEQRRSVARLQALDGLGEDTMIIFEPDVVKHTITVFTDIDCTYCRKLHREMPELQALGVKVRYVAYPRTGPGSKSWEKADWVWCADDRNTALTNAKADKPIEAKQCESPVDTHYNLGRQIGLTGTPAIVLESGDMFPGYIPAKILVQQLESLQVEQQPVSTQ